MQVLIVAPVLNYSLQYNLQECLCGYLPWHPQIVADQLTLSQSGGQIMPT